MRTRIVRSLAAAFGSLFLCTSGFADPAVSTLPTGGKVVAGSANILTNGAAMTITQSSARAAIDWFTFDIGAAASVTFAQPSASSVALNRVLSGSASEIAGRLSSNGQVYLVNSAGILFGRNAQVNVGGLVASTRDLATADFMVGSTSFSGTSDGRIVNDGQISAPNGYIAFIASDIGNNGRLQADGGTIALAAGERVTLRMQGDRLLDFSVDRSALQTLVDNQGAIVANGGQVLVSARAAGDLAGSVINNSGLIEANTLQDVNGVIRLSGAHGIQNDGQISAKGGSVATQSTNLLQQGRIEAADVALRADGRILHSGSTSASGDSGGSVLIQGGKDFANGDGVYLSGTVQANGAGAQGGRVAIVGADLTLAGASVEATGAQGGGSVTLGKGSDASGDAQSVKLLAGSRINVSATDHGNGGSALVWSAGSTQFAGAVLAQGGKHGGNGGAVEVSGKGLAYLGDVDTSASHGSAGSLLLDPMNINVVASLTPLLQLDDYFINPHPAGSGFATQVTPLANAGVATGNFVVTAPSDNLMAASSGAVYLFNGTSKALISTLTGSTASQQVGLGGVTALTNGNFVVASPASATWGNGSTGVSGTVSNTNSLTGFSGALAQPVSATYIFNSGSPVTALSNGNYTVADPYWSSGKGAVVWGNGATGTSGTVSASNALVGTLGTDYVGSMGVIALTNGNYVANSPWVANNGTLYAGAVTWGNGSTGTAGVVSVANSLVGSSYYDVIGGGGPRGSQAIYYGSSYAVQGVTALPNGNYVVRSPNVGSGAVNDPMGGTGAVTLGNGVTGTTGTVSAANSLVGGTAGDRIGHLELTVLTNGNYVTASPYWHNGAVVNAGAVTWASGTTAQTGVVSAANSLVGTATNDGVGARFYMCNACGASLLNTTPSGVVALTNGNYVVASANWAGKGAATWGNGTTGISGSITAANSLVGGVASTYYFGDAIGLNGVTALANGNYVVASGLWNEPTFNPTTVTGGAFAAGAVTWGNGASGSAGVVNASNSLVGSLQGDQIGRGATAWSGTLNETNGVVALSNGNYLVRSPRWGGGAYTATAFKGAATWGNGAGGTAGAVSAANSLVGASTTDYVGYDSATALPNGNAVLDSSYWGGNKGAVTLMSGTAATVGNISASNSLVGTLTTDRVGSAGVTALGSSGNFAVSSPLWNSYQGAVTWSNGSSAATSTLGAITAANSLLGYALPAYSPGVQFGSGGVVAAPNGDYAVLTNFVSSVTYSSIAAGGTANTGGTGVAAAQGMFFGTDATLANLGNFTGAKGYSPSNTPGSQSFFTAPLTKHVLGLGSSTGYNGGSKFADLPFVSVDLLASNLASTLASGTAVTLQANNDINVNGALTVGAGASNGKLSLQAGRNIFVNANIDTGGGALSLTANETAANGMVASGSSFRQNGTGGITMAAGTSLASGAGSMDLLVNNGNNSGNLQVRALTGGAISLSNNGAQAASKIVIDGAVNGTSVKATDLLGSGGIVVNAGGSITGTGAGDAVVLRTAGTAAITGFVNHAGAAALSAPAGRWLVYGTDPSYDARGMTVDGTTLFKRYNCSYAVGGCGNGNAPTVPAGGNGFLYSVAPNLTVSVSGTTSSVYGDSPTVAGLNATGYSGFIDGDTLVTAPVTGTPSFSTTATATSGVGSYAVTYGGGLGSGIGYGFNVSGGSHSVTARPLTVVLNSVNKTYDGSAGAATNGYSLQNMTAGDASLFSQGYFLVSGPLGCCLQSNNTRSNLTSSFSDKNVGTGKTITLNQPLASLVPVYANPTFGFVQATGNYTIVGITPGTGNITQRTLTTSLTTTSKVYDGNAIAAVNLADNRVAGDVLTVGYGSSTFANKNVGTAKAVTVSGLNLSGADAGNYAMAASTLSGTANISKRAITITGVTASDKVYDGNATATINGGVFSNFIAGDAITVGGLTGAFGNANAGNGKTVTVTGAATFAGADVGNYTITGASPTTTTASITPRALTVTLTPASKVYDGLSTAASNNYTVSGTVAGETVGLSNGALTPYTYNTGFGFTTLYGLTAVPTSFADKNAADGKTITLDPAPASVLLAYRSIFNGAAETWSGTGNYTIGTVVNSSGNITPRPVSLSGARSYDGGTAASASILSVTNRVSGDVLTLSGSATLASKNAGAEAISSMGSLALGGADQTNYSLANGGGSVSVAQAALTVAAPTVSKVYDASTTASGAPTLVGGTLYGGDTFSGGTLSFADKNVGAGNKTVNVGSVSINDGNGGANYAVTKQSNTVSSITPFNLNASVTVADKPYDGTVLASLTGASLAGVFAADAGSVSTDASTLSGLFVDKNAANNKTVNLSGALLLSGGNAGNYTVTTPLVATASITPKAVILAGVTASSKVYDGTTVASITGTPSLSGVLAGEDLGLNTGSVTASFADRNVGTAKQISVSGVALADGVAGLASNYRLNSGSTTATANITPASLTVSTGNVSKVYNAATDMTGASGQGAVVTAGQLYGGDSLSGGSFAYTEKNAGLGNRTVTVSGVNVNDGNAGNNYTLGYAPNTTSTITPAALTSSVATANKLYDGSTAATVTGASLIGVIGSDSVSAVSSAVTGTFDNRNAAIGKAVNLSGSLTLAGCDALNYTVTTPLTSSANITPANLTVSTGNVSKRYNASTDMTGASGQGAVVVAGQLYGPDTLSGGSFAYVGKDAGLGNKTVTVSGVSVNDGNSGGNYTLGYAANSTSTVTPAALTSSVATANKVYDGSTAATVTGASLIGVIGSDSVSGVSGAVTGTFDNRNAGTGKTVNLSGNVTLSGADALNYTVATPASSKADVTPASLTVSTGNVSKMYNASTDMTGAAGQGAVVVAGQLYGGDQISGGSFAYASKDAGLGNRTVTVSGVSVNDGNSGLNYALGYAANTTSTITPAALTSSVTAANKVYDGSAAATVTGASLIGVIGTDLVSGVSSALTGTFDNRNVGTDKTVNLSGNVTLSGADALNYTVTTPASSKADVTPASLTVSTGNVSKRYNASTDLTGAAGQGAVVVAGQLYGADSLSGGSFAYASKDAGLGNRTVTVSGVSVNDGNSGLNYTLGYAANTTSTITPAALTSSVAAANKVYDGSTAATVTGATLIGVLGSDTVSAVSSSVTGTFDNRNAGTVKTVNLSGNVTLSGADALNYTVATPASSRADVTPASLTVSTGNVSKRYNASTDMTGATGQGAVVVAGQLYGPDSLGGGSFAYTSKDAGLGNRTVTVSGVSVNDGNSGSNYTLGYAANSTSTITPSALTSSIAAANKVYDGSTTATVTGASLIGVIGSDSVSAVSSAVTGVFDNRNAGTGKTVNLSGSLTLSGADALNYTVATPASSKADVTPASLTVSTGNVSKRYNASTDMTGATGQGAVVVAGQLYGPDSLSGGSFAYASKDAGLGNRTVTVSGVSVNDGNSGNNYTLGYAANTTSTITPAALSSNVAVANKVYDGSTAATVTGATLLGVIGSDSVAGVSGAVTGTFDDRNAATGKTVNLAGSVTLSGADALNYTVATPPTSKADITPKALTLTGVGASNKVYDGTTAASLTGTPLLAGVLAGEDLSLNTAGVTANFIDRNVGSTKQVNVSGIALANGASGLASNYRLGSGSTSTTADITPLNLSATVAAANKVYDGATTATLTGASLIGVLAVDTGTVGTSAGSLGAAFVDKNQGFAKTVKLTGALALSGSSAGNYTVSTPASTTADIGARGLTVTPTAANKVYDATTAASITGVSDNRLGSDTLTVSYSGGTFSDKNVGVAKTVTLNGVNLSGADAANYTLLSPSTTTADIGARSLTVTASASNKVYDATTAATITTVTDNRVAGDLLSVGYSFGSFSDRNVGNAKTVSLNGVVLSGPDASNYVLAGPTTTTADITARNLTATVAASNKSYDGTTAATLAGASLSGVLGSDAVAASTSALSGQFDSKNVGSARTVSLSGKLSLAGADALNYTVSTPASSHADITPRTLSLAGVTVADKVYDGNTGASVTGAPVLLGLVSGEALNLDQATLSASFADRNAGAGKTVNVSGASLSDSASALAGNYVLGNSSTTATASITPRALTLSSSDVSKTYDGGTAAAGHASVVAGTLVSGDTVSGGNYAYTDKSVGLGNKTVTVVGVSVNDGNGGGNYAVRYQANSTSTISPASLGASVTSANKVYDASTAATLTGVSLSGVINGDNVNAGLGSVTGRFADKNVGLSKSVSLSGALALSGADAANYLVATPAQSGADITPRDLTATVTASSKVYDGLVTVALRELALGGVLASDAGTVTANLSGLSGSFANPNAGTAKPVSVAGSVQLQGTDASNYRVRLLRGTVADITPRPLVVTADDASKDAGQPNPAFSASASGLVAGDTLAGLGGVGLSSAASTASPGGSYAIVASGLASPNYSPSYVDGVLTVRTAAASVPQAATLSLGESKGSERLSDGEGSGCGGRRASFFAYFDSSNCLPEPRQEPSYRVHERVLTVVGAGLTLPAGVAP